MPVNNQNKLLQTAVGDNDQKLVRPGGAASKGSKPVLQDSSGSGFQRMQAVLMGQKDGLDAEDVKKLTPGSKGQQFKTLASAEKAPAPKKGIFRVQKKN